MAATDEGWARGYAIQALSDLDTRDKLAEAGATKCHRLHFLQMAAEKTCKAFLTNENGHENVRKSHAYVARILPIIARVYYPRINHSNQINQWEISEIKKLAEQIELLAPACHEGGLREDNSEYPWEGVRGEVCIPCEYNFPGIDDGSKAIVRLIKLIREAAESYRRLATNH